MSFWGTQTLRNKFFAACSHLLFSTGAGVFFLACAEGEHISFLFDCIVQGISPSRGPFGLRPVLPGEFVYTEVCDLRAQFRNFKVAVSLLLGLLTWCGVGCQLCVCFLNYWLLMCVTCKFSVNMSILMNYLSPFCVRHILLDMDINKINS